MPKRRNNKADVLAFIQEGESFALPNGETLAMNPPTVGDLVSFQRRSEELKGSDDIEALAEIPATLLQSVTKEYGFTVDEAMGLLLKCGGPDGALGRKVYSLYGIDVDRVGKGDGESDPSVPTE